VCVFFSLHVHIGILDRLLETCKGYSGLVVSEFICRYSLYICRCGINRWDEQEWSQMIHPSKVVYLVSRWLDFLAGGALVAMTLLLVGNILSRLLWRPIFGTYEIVQFLTALVNSFAIAYCCVQGGHVTVSLVMERFSKRTLSIIGSIIDIISTGLFIVIGWQCIVYAENMRHVGELSPTLGFPFYPFVYGIGFGCLMLSTVLLVGFFKSLVGLVSE
jgi:TRAP-type C4-dicarboxylate transport system permease small subunit